MVAACLQLRSHLTSIPCSPCVPQAALFRLRTYLSPGASAYIVGQVVAALASLAWCHSCRDRPDGGSHARWREPLAGAVRLAGFGFGAAWVMSRQFVDGLGSSPLVSLGAAYNGTLFLLCTGVPTALLLWFKVLRIRWAGWRQSMAHAASGWLRRHAAVGPAVEQQRRHRHPGHGPAWRACPPPACSWAAPIQLAVILHNVSYSAYVCASPTLSHAAMRRLTHHLFQLLSLLRSALDPAGAKCGAAAAHGTAECSALVAFMQLACGFAAPVAVQACWESRLFEEHQRQRQELGLPSEQGLLAQLYSRISKSAPKGGLAALVWALWLAILWDLSLVLTASGSHLGAVINAPL